MQLSVAAAYREAMLIAEELLLLLTRPDGRPVGSSTHDVGVAGAFLCELAQQGRVTVDERGRLHVVDASPTADPLLDLVWGELAAREGKKPKNVLPKVGKDLPTAVYHRLAERGLVVRQESRVLWLFTRVSWPVVGGDRREQAIAELARVLRDGQAPDARTGALVALIQATGSTAKLLGDPSGLPRREAVARAKDIARGDWASAAVAKAISDAQAAVAASAAVIAAAGAASS